ncbi:MAG: type I 3-dehydroquinate dehydratase [Vicinamibacterales bacterium]
MTPPARLCVTVTAATMAELRERRDRVTGADLVELRLDGVDRPDVAGALEGRRLPVIVTCRPTWEGGRYAGPEEARQALLAEALALGAEYVDVEWRAGFTDLVSAGGGRRIVLSMHDFTGVPDDLAAQVAAMSAVGAEVVKVAVMASRLDTVPALAALADRAPRMALIAMGEAGLPSRLLASRLGSCWTYAGDGAAPGQVPLERFRDEMGFARIGPATALFGVVGRPVLHSRSPAMHNAAFRAAGVDAVHLPLAAADFDDFLAFADWAGLAGASVTAPFKIDALERADDCDAVSREVGAANTLRRRGGRWEARNTDVAGFLGPLQDAVPLRGARVTVLGAGGAARAVAVALGSKGARVRVAARRPGAAAAVAALAAGEAVPWPPPAGWDVIVNTTPVGTWPGVDETPLPGGPFSGGVAYDLVYAPPETRFLRDAAAAGLATIGGLEMLVAQAGEQFEWWTGQPAPARVMRDAAAASLARDASRASGTSTETV